MSKSVYQTKTAEETRRLGEELAQSIKSPIVIALFGELGSGKTTFVQGLAKGLGITQRIISPTFIIVRTYNIKFKNSKFYHIDLYRIENAQDIQGLGLKEILEDPEAIVAIEWAEKIPHLLSSKTLKIHCAYHQEHARTITISK